MDAKIFAHEIAEIIYSKKGSDVKLLDLSKVSSIADYFIICTGDSDTQVKAIADEIDRKMREKGIKANHIEGVRALNWVLLDYFDVVVHIFKSDSRKFYNLERLWGDAPCRNIKDQAIPS